MAPVASGRVKDGDSGVGEPLMALAHPLVHHSRGTDDQRWTQAVVAEWRHVSHRDSTGRKKET